MADLSVYTQIHAYMHMQAYCHSSLILSLSIFAGAALRDFMCMF